MCRRRANGEGTVYRTGDGRWRGQASIAGKRRSVSGRTRAAVAEELRRIIATGRAASGAAETSTLAALLDRWLDEVVGPTLRARTVKLYRDIARLHLVPALGAVPLVELCPEHVRRLHAALLALGRAPKTVRIAHGVLHGALQQAVVWQLVQRNVAGLARPPRVPRKEAAFLDTAQVRRLLEVAAGGRWAALFTLALATGMRQGELLGLRWEDIDFDAGFVRVQRQLGRDGVLAEPKTASGRRTIDLPSSAIGALRSHRREREARPPTPGFHEPVFCTRTGRPLCWRNVSRAFQAHLRQAALPAVPFHALRHTAVALLIRQGVHPKVVQERLGHSSAATTLDYYGHLLPGLGRDAATRLDALLA